MSEVINNNVFADTKKFVDLSSLDYFWDKAKAYIDGVDVEMSGKVAANEAAIQSINDELNSLSGGAGSIQTQIANAIEALKLAETYEAKGDAAKAQAAAEAYADSLADNYDAAGAAAQALQDAKDYADGKFQVAGNYEAAGTAAGLNEAMDARVKVLEGIDHAALATDAADAAVARVVAGAPEAFDTLKDVADWIANNDHATDVAGLMTDVANLKAIDHNAYVAADETVLASAKVYADDEIAKLSYDEAGAAAAAEAAAKKYADEEIAKLSYDAAGSAEAALAEAKSYVDGKDTAMNGRVAALEAVDHNAFAKAANVYVKSEVDAAVAAAEAAAKADAAEALKAYYTKTEVDNLLATNTAADQAYAKNYTDALFNSFKFAQNSDIDALFAE